MMGTFADRVNDWCRETPERLTAAYRRSVELLGEEMSRTRGEGGKVPFLTGNLARSLLASTASMPSTAVGPFSAGGNVGAATAGLEFGAPVWLGYQARYARRLNYGFTGQDRLGRTYNQQGAGFVEHAIAKWPQIVAQAANEIRAGVTARQS